MPISIGAGVAFGIGPTGTTLVGGPPYSYTVSYLVVAGGGGGGETSATTAAVAGGGGAGGMLTGNASLTSGTVYSVTVGNGGGSITGTGSTNSNGNNGNNSSFGSIACLLYTSPSPRD